MRRAHILDPLFELLQMSPRTRQMVMERANATQIAEVARSDGELTSLREAGFGKIRTGETSIEEVLLATKM